MNSINFISAPQAGSGTPGDPEPSPERASGVSAVSDIDAAIAEFDRAVAELFHPERREIERLKSRIAERKRAHKGTAILQHELCELMARQVRRECEA